MFKSNQPRAIAVSIAIAVFAIAITRLTAQSAPDPLSPTTMPSRALIPSDHANTIAQQKLLCAQSAIQFAEQMRDKGMEPNLQDMALWSRCMLDAQLDVATTPADKTDAINDYLQRMRRLDVEASHRYQRGLISLLDKQSITYQRLEAQQLADEQQPRTK
jgi:hypothetical protein